MDTIETMFTPEESRSALKMIRDHVRKTPLQRSSLLEGDGGGEVWLKLENHQVTGSFKIRGAFNKMLSMDDSIRSGGVVTASTGNHGCAVARAGLVTNTPVTVFVPENADRSKTASIESDGAQIIHRGIDCVESESAARDHADVSGRPYISPYNDVDVVTGQSTVAVELDEQADQLDAVIVSMGGGGLVGGIGGYLKSIGSDADVIACSPENSCVMHQSMEAGRILDVPSQPTLSDGTAGGVEEGSITFDLCRRVVDRSILLTERQIADAMRFLVSREHLMVEGAAALALAGFMKIRHEYVGRNVAIILCGCNVSSNILKEVLS